MPETATADAAPAAQSQPPEPFDLTREDDNARSKAGLGLLDPNVEGWLLIGLRRRGIERHITIQGFVPIDSYPAYMETLRRIEGALLR